MRLPYTLSKYTLEQVYRIESSCYISDHESTVRIYIYVQPLYTVHPACIVLLYSKHTNKLSLSKYPSVILVNIDPNPLTTRPTCFTLHPPSLARSVPQSSPLAVSRIYLLLPQPPNLLPHHLPQSQSCKLSLHYFTLHRSPLLFYILHSFA